jgi:hypothetical protein
MPHAEEYIYKRKRLKMVNLGVSLTPRPIALFKIKSASPYFTHQLAGKRDH